MQQTNPPTPQGDERRAFVFYTNWYYDVAQSLTPEEQGTFLLVIVRYVAEGILPGDDVSPHIRTMFGLIRNVLDTDRKKYDQISDENRRKAEKRHIQKVQKDTAREKRRKAAEIPAETAATVPADAAPNDYPQVYRNHELAANKPIHNTQYTEHNTQNTVEEKKEEETLARLDEVVDYWQLRHFRSDPYEFYNYYEANGWRNNRREPLRSWRSAAIAWEDKFRRDVLPVRRREAMAEAELQLSRQKAEAVSEAQRERELQRQQREAEAAQRAQTAVAPQTARIMYDRALLRTGGDQEAALLLLRQAESNATLFQELAAGP